VLPFVEALTSKKDADGNQIGKFVGLGARDTLRLEAGLCLYGHELNEETSPIEAVLGWTISKRRKENGGFLGDAVVKKHLKEGVERKRVGFIVEGPPAREGVEIQTKNGEKVGVITSGTHSPTLKKSLGQAYINSPHNKLETEL
jgi:aminomethyltransferase